MTRCFPARQTAAHSNRTHTAASFRSSDGPVSVKNMMIDYRMQASRAAVPWAARMQVECLFPHVPHLQCAAGGGAAGEPTLLAVAKAASRQVSRRHERALGETSAAANDTPPAACDMDSCRVRRRSFGD